MHSPPPPLLSLLVRAVISLSVRKPGFDSRSSHVVEKVQLRPVFSPSTQFSHCLYHSTTAPNSCSSRLLNCTKLICLHSTFVEMSTDSDRHKLSLNNIQSFLISNFRSVVKVVFSFV